MHRKLCDIIGLVVVIALTLTANVAAQQHREHHRDALQAPDGQSTTDDQDMPAQMPMMQRMRGMMEHMQGMMQHMQGMMGGRSMTGMMRHRGMMADDAEDDDDEGMMRGSMMGRGMMAPMDDLMGHRGMMGHGHKMLRKMEHLMRQLDLTDEQASQVRSRLRTHMKDAIQLRADMAAQRIDLLSLLDAEPVDMTKVKVLLHNIAMKRADLQFAHIDLRQEIDNLLTPEQREKLRSMRGHMMQGQGMKGRGGMRGHGKMMRPSHRGGHGGMRNPCGKTPHNQ